MQRQVMLTSLLSGLVAFCAAGVVSAETALTADGLVDSIGVNTHLAWEGTAYDHFDDVIQPRLKELGIRHLRDHMFNANPLLEQRQRALADVGMKFLLITQIDMPPENISGWLERLGPDAVSAVEGPNEYDLHGGDNWAAELQNHTQMLWSLIKNDPEFSDIMVAGPTLVDWMVDDYPAMGDQSAFMDAGNFHWYYAGWPPSATGAEHKQLEIILDRYRQFTGDTRFIMSECGYHNALPDRRYHWGTPEDVEAKYLPRMFLFQYGYGLIRSFSYEFIDQYDNPDDRETSFGLLRSSGEPKPVFNTVKNLITLLQDPGPEYQTEDLDFTLSGDTADVQTVLMQKRNGDFYLAVWSGKPIWQPVDQVVLTPEPQSVSLQISTAIREIHQARPNQTTDWEQLDASAGTWQLSADDEVLLLRIVPEESALGVPDEPIDGPLMPVDPNAGGMVAGGTPPTSVTTPAAGGDSSIPAADLDSSAGLMSPVAAGDEAGCGCATASRTRGDSALWGLALLMTALWCRRRRNR